jgi:hypothetical protein
VSLQPTENGQQREAPSRVSLAAGFKF